MTPPGFAFANGGLDRAAHLRETPEALDALWLRARVLRLDAESRALDGPARQDWTPGGAISAERPDEAVFLGMLGADALFAVERPAEGQATTDLRCAGLDWPDDEASVFAAAAGLLNWRRRSRHCGACGGENAFRQAGWSARCTRCGLETYPRIDPAIIVAVSAGDRLLLGRQRSWPPGRWSLVAGFVEPGAGRAARGGGGNRHPRRGGPLRRRTAVAVSLVPDAGIPSRRGAGCTGPGGWRRVGGRPLVHRCRGPGWPGGQGRTGRGCSTARLRAPSVDRSLIEAWAAER